MECRLLRGRMIRLVCAFTVAVTTVAVVTTVSTPSVSAQETETVLESLVERIERLERDNQRLKQQVEHDQGSAEPDEPESSSRVSLAPWVVSDVCDAGTRRLPVSNIYQFTAPVALFAGNYPEPLLDEQYVRHIIAEEIAQSTPDGAHTQPEEDHNANDARQDHRIADLDKMLKSLQEKSSKKTYPNVTVNGVFQADAGWIHQDAASETRYGDIQDGSDFRRARLSAKGSVTELTNYFFQMDFGFFGRPTFTDVWLEQTKVPLFGNVRIGQWKQPFGLETVSSFRYTTFMERSVLFQPFTPFRHIGIGFYDHADDLSTTWAASVFRTGQDQFGATLTDQGGYGTAERLTWVPSWECNGKNYLHLGVGHFFNAPPDDTINFRTIPEFYVGNNGPGAVGTSGQAVPGGANGTPFFVATGPLNVPYYNVLGSELLWVRGPVSLQSEAMVSLVNQGGGGSAALPGAYAQVGYFLTGEHRPYDRKTGQIDRVIPKSNLTFHGNNCNPGLGAWEVAGRWSYLDLNDSTINGGTLTDYTAGLNWYWNPYTKMVFNYVHAISDGTAAPQAQTDMFGMRAQIDF